MRTAVLIALALALPTVAQAASDTLGKTTLQQRIAGGDRSAYSTLHAAPGEGFMLREDLGGKAKAGREQRRRSLLYFGQLSDFQLADEESPARVEVTDQANTFFAAAWRPQEALMPFVVDRSIRQMNQLAGASPVPQGDGTRARMGLTVITGDNADNNQRNEAAWVETLLDGGRLDPNSGSANPADYAQCPPGTPGPDEAARYTGVQDYDDYTDSANFYDPEVPQGKYAAWPKYPGLMDRAQMAFDTPGLKVPVYVEYGNHDLLVQGNQAANQSFRNIATGCRKYIGQSLDANNPFSGLSPTAFTSHPENTFSVPPDPRRAQITAPEYRRLLSAHGMGLVDPKEVAASAGAAGYYTFSPRPGLRFIGVETVCNGGVAGPCADGNVDDPQFRWLTAQLDAAEKADELVILFSHHAPVSLTADVPDEAAPGCSDRSHPEASFDPGCDFDPRSSQPIHLGGDLLQLALGHKHVIAWVAGHSHVNDVTPYARAAAVGECSPSPCPPGAAGGLWVVRTSAEADWPHQDRIFDLMDNADGTLSLFAVLIDGAAPITAPPAGANAGAFDGDQLASLARTLGYNDPQNGGGTGEGTAKDHNVELVMPDPRTAVPPSTAKRPKYKIRVTPRRVRAGRRALVTVRVTLGRKPVKRLLVRFAGARHRTDRIGRARFRVRLRKPGLYSVRVSGSKARVRVRATRR